MKLFEDWKLFFNAKTDLRFHMSPDYYCRMDQTYFEEKTLMLYIFRLRSSENLAYVLSQFFLDIRRVFEENVFCFFLNRGSFGLLIHNLFECSSLTVNNQSVKLKE